MLYLCVCFCNDSCPAGGGSTLEHYITFSALISVLLQPPDLTAPTSVLHHHLSYQLEFISESYKH